MKSKISSTLALILLLPLAACSPSQQNDSQPGAADHVTSALKDAGEKISPSAISGEIRKGIEEAKQELASENIDVNSIHINNRRHDDDSRPKAQITPAGDLLIANKKIPATPEQHALLLDYRSQIVGIAAAGMDVGAQGADLGLNAAKQALLGSFSGKSGKEIEAGIKPQAEKIRAAALQLCQRLPSLLSSQQKLASAMPEFRPYATMEQKDIDDCGKHGKNGITVLSD
jgi:hypothetical protein